MKAVNCLLILSLFATIANAQSRKISLKTSNLDGKVPTGMNISGIQVINAVSDSSLLGFVQTGMFNHWTDAGPDKPYTLFLQSYADEQYASIYKKDAPQLVWVIKELRISERSFNMSERGFVHLKAIAYTGNERFKWLTQMDTILVTGGMDVTHKHGDHIAEALQLLLEASLTAKQRDSPAYSLAEIKEKAIQRYQKPAFQAKEHENGIYMTFEEFLNDAPSVLNVIAVDEGFYHKDSAGNKVFVNKFWGIRRDGQLYKLHEDKIIPIEQQQNALVLSNYLSTARHKNSAIMGSALGGGLIGGAIAESATSGMLPMIEVPYINKKKSPMATGVDIETGEFTL
jgi:hypothetical protein